jgi:hypothetical protein
MESLRPLSAIREKPLFGVVAHGDGLARLALAKMRKSIAVLDLTGIAHVPPMGHWTNSWRRSGMAMSGLGRRRGIGDAKSAYREPSRLLRCMALTIAW